MVLLACNNEEDLIKHECARMLTIFFLILPYGSYLLPWKQEFLVDLAQKVLQPFSRPNDASEKEGRALIPFLAPLRGQKMKSTEQHFLLAVL